MKVKSIAECSKGSIQQYRWSSLGYHLSLRSLFLSIFEWPFYTSFTVFTMSIFNGRTATDKHFKWASAWNFQQCGMCDQQSLRSACAYAQSDQSLCLSLEYSMTVKLLTEHHLEFLSLKGGCTGSTESTLVKLLEITCHGSNVLCLNNIVITFT